MRARADVRARPVSLVLVTILVGLIGGLGITALAASRRSDSAYTRYRQLDNEPDAVVLSCPGSGFLAQVDLPQVRALPEVTSSAIVSFIPVDLEDAKGTRLLTADEMSVSVIGLRRAEDAAILRPRLLAGRMPTGADEVAIGYMPSASPPAAIGDTVILVPPTAGGGPAQQDPGSLVKVPVHITGQVLIPGDLTQDQNNVWGSPALVAALSRKGPTCDALAVHLRHGLGDSASFLAGVYRVTPAAFVLDLTNEAIYVSRTTHLEAIILRLLAILAAIAGIMILGQSLVRRTSLGGIDIPILRSLGMTRRQILWGATLPALIVAAGGSLIAVTIAVAASSSFPSGVSRIADPQPGILVDRFAVLLGVGAIVATSILSVIVPALRLVSARSGVEGSIEYRGAERRSRIASAIARLPLPPSAGAGARLALEPGHGRSATPVRSAAIGLSLAVTAMVAAFGFSASMGHFGATPRLAGYQFDFGTGQPFGGDLFEKQALPVLEKDPQVADLSTGNFQHYLTITGPRGATQDSAWGLKSVKGEPVTTTMLEGRWATGPGEVALGRETAVAVGADVGDTVTVSAASTSRSMRVVGIAVFPDNGFGPGLGRGMAITFDDLTSFFPGLPQNLAFGRFTSDADRVTVIDRLNKEVLNDIGSNIDPGPESGGGAVTGTLRSRTLPLRLSFLFAFAAFATLVHVLLTSVRRRRRDLAILQTLGFRRGQVAATVAWQAIVLSTVALVIGVPLGILVGRLGWGAFAYRLGVVDEPVMSPWAVIVVPLTLIVAVIVSLGPGIVARRVRPAQVLRAE